ncbi:MAG: hypothetical protein KAX44_07460, partial [Candidatus Brocadiae bacterium]|nr:hypothetical protein [Candidatus Brocadiia bacterium]
MRSILCRAAAVCSLFVLGSALGFAAGADGLPAPTQDFLQTHPGTALYHTGDQITRVYGAAFGFGADPEDASQGFVRDYAEIFGVDASDLLAYGPTADGRHTQPVMYDREIDQYKFTLVYYTQSKDGIPVFRSELRLLVRNEPGHPLVLASSSLHDLGNFRAALDLIDSEAGKDSARALMPDLVNFTDAELVIWSGVSGKPQQPAVAVTFIGDNGLPATPDYNKWLFVTDATTGKILYKENMILNTDVVGNVSGNATQGLGADICGPEEPTVMPYAQVSIVGGSTAYADENGDFVIPNGGSGLVTVRSPVLGRWFNVNNQAGSDTVLEQDVTPPGPADFLHNQANTSEYKRAEVNGYVHANVVRDFTLVYNPAYPGLQQTSFPVNVNLANTCNAYYDYSSINFFRSGGGCPNTAFSTVVHHEYGHHLVAMAGSGQGQYGEGMSDVMGVLITDDSGLAYGFYSNCNQPLRDADNTKQYPCSGGSHECGKLISGCVWSTRNELIATYPDDYRDILANLAINAMLMHTGDQITPEITIDWLTLDDDDGNIGNGTPHYPEICAGFGDHNMDCPRLRLIDFVYPDGLPEVLTPDQPTTVRVNVIAVNAEPQPGTGTVTYRTDGGSYQEVAMTETAPNEYEATLPAVACGSLLDFYFSADTTGGETVTDPYDAPASTYSAPVMYGTIVVFEYLFDSNPGWTTQDQWAFGQPTGGGTHNRDPQAGYTGANVY